MTRKDEAVVEERLRATYAAITSRTSYSSPPRLPMMVEALHDEPRPRVRRSWRRVAVAAAVAAALVIATLVLVRTESDDGDTVLTPAGTAPSAPAPAPSTQAPTPLGPPLFQGPDAASTIVTSWGQIHVGYVFVYGDGRVLFTSDGLVMMAGSFDPSLSGVAERHLTALGLDLVRAGTFDPKEIVEALAKEHLSARELDLARAGKLDPKEIVERLDSGWLPNSPYGREELWVEPTAHIYEPTAYALCQMLTFPGYVVRHPRDVAAELPADLQPLLDGKQHTYNPIIGTAHWLPAREGPQAGVPYATTLDLTGWDCFELTAEELSTLPNRGAFGDGRPPYGSLQALAIHPHGQPVVWAG